MLVHGFCRGSRQSTQSSEFKDDVMKATRRQNALSLSAAVPDSGRLARSLSPPRARSSRPPDGLIHIEGKDGRIETVGGKAPCAICDVTNEQAVKEDIAAAIGDSVRLAVVANSAGMAAIRSIRPMRTIAHQIWTTKHSSFALGCVFLPQRKEI